ncbi:peptidase M48, Ste24p [Psychromonas sp. CNPT3]|uniref:beta-barrel assembly-enhancing protease n=1 Tax=Psychromonas sp. CNPT3 TaxID=314282 RepID=UPI00006E769A|nr:M48 family metalloprotease [Psychromonas sp. CNPT3]AGH81701.1 peptidase M48, Ste24p [Psychromonas sp. CNPT3]
MSKQGRLGTMFLILLFFSRLSYAQNDLPDIGTVGAGALSLEKEKEYGWAFHLLANQSLPIIYDPVLNNYINNLGQNLVAHADSVKLAFNFFLIDDKEINAAAFLGGNVKIHTGLFLYAKNESELAGVISHEIAHITQRHLARMLERQSLSNPASMAAMAGSVLLALVSPAAGIAALTTSMAVNAQMQINYTRLHEYEADRLGIQTLYNAGYDPSGMANFFSKLAQKYQYASMPPAMLSTHPLTETRLAEARLRADRFPKRRYKAKLAYQLSKARISVRFNNISAPAAINYYKNQLTNHRYLIQDSVKYALALAYFKNKQPKKAHEIALTLLHKMPHNLFYLDLITDTSIQLKNPILAIDLLSKEYKAHPKNTVLALNLVVALQANKQDRQAEKILALFLRKNPQHILAHLMAIDVYKTLKDRAKEHATRAEYYSLLGRFRAASEEIGSALIYTQSTLDRARYSAKIEVYRQQDLRLQALQK